MLRLHGFCQSGNTFKVALMLRALQLDWEPVYVDFMRSAPPSPRGATGFTRSRSGPTRTRCCRASASRRGGEA
jgi:hypothetical protein